MNFGIVWGLEAAIVVFSLSALAIIVSGIAMTAIADQISDQSGLGEASFGALFLGGVTSLSGSVLSINAALNYEPSFAVNNALGGLAAQTLFLCIGDFLYKRANLEHAVASTKPIFFGLLFCIMITVTMMASVSPHWLIGHIDVYSILLIIIYIVGGYMITHFSKKPMWSPEVTSETRFDVPEPNRVQRSFFKNLVYFGILALILAMAGIGLERSGNHLVEATDLTNIHVAFFMTAIITSLPELVTTLTAIHRGALALAVGGIIGGNTFDILFISFSDFAYDKGSIFAEFQASHQFAAGLALLMTLLLVMGLFRRERRGPGRVGLEGVLITLLYIVGSFILLTMATA